LIPVTFFRSIIPSIGGLFTTRVKIYETDLANHGIHYVQEVQDTIILKGDSALLTTVPSATTCHYGIDQGKAANTDIQAPVGKSLTIAQFGVIPSGGPEFRLFKIMASNTVNTDDGTQLFAGGVSTSTAYVPYPLTLPAGKFLTLVYTSQPSAGRNIQATAITVIEEN